MNLGINMDTGGVQGKVPGSPPDAGGAAPGTPPESGTPVLAFGQLMAMALEQRMASQDPAQGLAPGPSPDLLTEVGETTDPSALASGGAEHAPALAGDGGLPLWLDPLAHLPPVQQITVGPSLQAITASTPAPDLSSLTAFARQQGLDAEAIAWLMASRPGSAGASPSTWVSALGPSPGAMPEATAPIDPNGLPGQALLRAPTPGTAGAAAVMAGAAAIPGWAQSVNTALAAPATQPGTATAPPTAEPDPAALQAGAVLIGQIRWNGGRGDLGSATVRTPSGFASAPLPVWTVDTLDLAAMLTAHGDPDPATDPATDPPATEDGLSAAPGPSSLPAQEPPALSRHQHASTHAGARAEAASAPTPSASTDQMQRLSEQMADAIGERMLREIERGHWNLRLMLKPAHLGHIEVEMRLRGGELDATFAAPHAATRDLLQDGLQRLRESLAHAGMDVANLDVKNGQNRQNGGDSTPGQRAFATNAKDAQSQEKAAPVVESTPRPRRQDGWDVLV